MPYMAIVGAREVEGDSVAVRVRGAGNKQDVMPVEAFLGRVSGRGRVTPGDRADDGTGTAHDSFLLRIFNRDHRVRRNDARHPLRLPHAHREIPRRARLPSRRLSWGRSPSGRQWRRAGIAAASIDEVIMGHVLQGGAGQAPGRQAMIQAGLPGTIPAVTINKVCGSGPQGGDARRPGDQGRRMPSASWRAGMEAMSASPHYVYGMRTGHQGRQPDHGGRDDSRRPLGFVRHRPHGELRRIHRPKGRGLPAGPGRVRLPEPSEGSRRDRGRQIRRGDRTGRRARERRDRPGSRRTRGRARTPPSRRWPSSSPHSRRMAASRPGMRRGSMTVPAR